MVELAIRRHADPRRRSGVAAAERALVPGDDPNVCALALGARRVELLQGVGCRDIGHRPLVVRFGWAPGGEHHRRRRLDRSGLGITEVCPPVVDRTASAEVLDVDGGRCPGGDDPQVVDRQRRGTQCAVARRGHGRQRYRCRPTPEHAVERFVVWIGAGRPAIRSGGLQGHGFVERSHPFSSKCAPVLEPGRSAVTFSPCREGSHLQVSRLTLTNRTARVVATGYSGSPAGSKILRVPGRPTSARTSGERWTGSERSPPRCGAGQATLRLMNWWLASARYASEAFSSSMVAKSASAASASLAACT